MALADFESRIHRSSRYAHRSPRLRALVAAVKAFELSPSQPLLDAIRLALARWQKEDPKEYADRGAALRPELDAAIASAPRRYRGEGAIPLVEPSSHPVFDYPSCSLWCEGHIRASTNCYAYACDDPFNHANGYLPQPGLYMKAHDRKQWAEYRAEDKDYSDVVRFEGVEKARELRKDLRQKLKPLATTALPDAEKAMRDWNTKIRFRVALDDMTRRLKDGRGMTPIINSGPYGEIWNIPGHYLVALLVANDDYHWYRQDNTGYWSHKPGNTEPTNLDYAGRLIVDPRTANNGRYRLSAFYHVPRGGLRTASAGDLALMPTTSTRGRRG